MWLREYTVGHSKELNRAVIGCHHCNKSVCKLSSLPIFHHTLWLVFLKSGSIWEPQQLSHEATKSYRAESLSDEVQKSHQCLAASKPSLALTSALKLWAGSFMALVSMAQKLHASLTSQTTMPSVWSSGVQHADTGLWSSGFVVCGVTNYTSLAGSLMDESGFGKCQRNITCVAVPGQF